MPTMPETIAPAGGIAARESDYAEAMADESTGIYEQPAASASDDIIASLDSAFATPAAEAPEQVVLAAPIPAAPPQQNQGPRSQKTSRNWRESTYESSSVIPQQAPSAIRKVVLLNSTEPGEIRVAILENGELAEIFMERKSHHQQAGNIYKGRVVNVEPSLQAAFIDLGAERNGFLHASDVIGPDGGYSDILEKKVPDRNQNRGRNDQPRPNRDTATREKGATPPSVIAAQQAEREAAGAAKPPPNQFGMAADGPLLLNRPARPTMRPDYRPPQPVPALITPPPPAPSEPNANPGSAPPAEEAAGAVAGVDADPPMPVVPGQPYPMQGPQPFPLPQPFQQQGGFQNRDGKRRRRRRGGRARSNRARPPGAAPMLAPNRNFMPPGQPGSTQPEHPLQPNQSGDALVPDPDQPKPPEGTDPNSSQATVPPAQPDHSFPLDEQQPAPVAHPASGHFEGEADESADERDNDAEDGEEVNEDDLRTGSEGSSSNAQHDAAVSSDANREALTENAPAPAAAQAVRPPDEISERMDRADELADQLEEDEAHQPVPAANSTGDEGGEEAKTRLHEPVQVSSEVAHNLDSDDTATASIADIVTKSFEPIAPGAAPAASAEGAPRVVPPKFQPQRKGNGRKERSYDRRYTIQEMLREGQEVLVQVAKEGIGQKGPALTTYISLPGRYLVLMPAVSRLGVSKRIDSEEQRRALKEALSQLSPPDDMGVIVRTAGMGRSKEELQRDMEYLMRAWDGLKERTKASKAPSLIYQEGDVVTRVFRDVLTEDVTEIIIDDPVVMERAREFLRETSPGSEKKLKLYADAEPLFHRYNVEQQMQRLFNRKVNLRNRGSIVIEQTEALVAIDVNTGGFREKRNQDDTILQTNLEAAREIARQLRLRDIGGLVMIDFIDMEIYEHRRRVERELKAHLARDKAKINVLPVSSLGVVEMTRQRIRHSLRKTLFDRCPHCSGSGHVKSAESVGLEMLREIKAQIRDKTVRRVKVLLNAQAAYAILNLFRKELVRMEEANGISIEVCGDPGVALSQMQVSIAKEGGDWVLKKVSEVDDYVRNS